jgi:poly-gamma-glutamate capsule biosynthesis protein CapA/YwtB (metallophosphatase superfamily)
MQAIWNASCNTNAAYNRQAMAKLSMLKNFACFWLASILSASAVATEASQPLSILFAGDIVLDGQPGVWVSQGKDPLQHFAAIFKSTDITVANLECVVTDKGQASNKIFTFRASPAALPVLHRHVDVVALANNHSGDFGKAAFADMLDRLEKEQLPYVGGGRNLSTAHQPFIIHKHGLKLALLSYNEFMPRSFEAGANQAGIAWGEDEQVVQDIRAAREKYHADLVIPFMHWGWENEKNSSQRQQQLAKLMIDAGADAVVGGHPHVTQEIDIYRGKPIFYSIGNFVIDALDNEEQSKGWIVRLQLDATGVLAWDTRMAKISDDGIPDRVPEAMTPCWSRTTGTIRNCSNRNEQFTPDAQSGSPAEPR